MNIYDKIIVLLTESILEGKMANRAKFWHGKYNKAALKNSKSANDKTGYKSGLVNKTYKDMNRSRNAWDKIAPKVRRSDSIKRLDQPKSNSIHVESFKSQVKEIITEGLIKAANKAKKNAKE